MVSSATRSPPSPPEIGRLFVRTKNARSWSPRSRANAADASSSSRLCDVCRVSCVVKSQEYVVSSCLFEWGFGSTRRRDHSKTFHEKTKKRKKKRPSSERFRPPAFHEPRGNNGTSRVSSLKRRRRSRAAASDAPRGHAPCGRPPPRAPPRRCPRARRRRPKRPSGTRGESGRASPRPSPQKILQGRPPRRPSQERGRRPHGSRTVRRASCPCPSSAASRAPRRPYSAASPGASPRRGNTPPPADASCASRCRSRRDCRVSFFVVEFFTPEPENADILTQD